MTGACTRRGGKAGEGRRGRSRIGGKAKESREGQGGAGQDMRWACRKGYRQEGERIRSESKMRCVGY